MTQPANVNAKPTRKPTNKTLAATSGSIVGSAIATIVLYLIQYRGGTYHALPGEVLAAITIVMNWLRVFNIS